MFLQVDSFCDFLARTNTKNILNSSTQHRQVVNARVSQASDREEDDSLITELKSQVEEAGRRTTKLHVDEVFKQHANGDGSKRGIKLPEFRKALCAVRPEFHYLSVEETKRRFVDSDVKNNGFLTEAEFDYALETAFPLEQALSRLPLHRLVETALPGFYTRPPTDHVEIFSNLSDREIACMVQAVMLTMQKILRETAHELKRAIAPQQTRSDDSGSKFSITLNGGNVDDFYAGLSGRVGGETFKKAEMVLISGVTPSGYLA